MERADPCRICYARKVCLIHAPVGRDGSVPNAFFNCMYYTCVQGRVAARVAHDYGVKEDVILGDGQCVQACPFGTHDKPTRRPQSPFRRFVTGEGEIIAGPRGGPYRYTGQKI